MFKADVTLESLVLPYIPLRNFHTTFDTQYICRHNKILSVDAYTLENNNLHILSHRALCVAYIYRCTKNSVSNPN